MLLRLLHLRRHHSANRGLLSPDSCKYQSHAGGCPGLAVAEAWAVLRRLGRLSFIQCLRIDIVAKEQNEVGPDWRPPDWVQMEPLWEKIRDVRDALSTDDLKGKYLKQALGDRDTSYLVRIELAEMGEDLEETIKANTGLLSKFDLRDDTPQTLKDNIQNVDLAGTNLRMYQANAVASAFANECVLLGCHTQRKEEAGGSRRPYFSIVDIPKSVYAPRVEVIDDE